VIGHTATAAAAAGSTNRIAALLSAALARVSLTIRLKASGKVMSSSAASLSAAWMAV